MDTERHLFRFCFEGGPDNGLIVDCLPEEPGSVANFCLMATADGTVGKRISKVPEIDELRFRNRQISLCAEGVESCIYEVVDSVVDGPLRIVALKCVEGPRDQGSQAKG